MQFDTKIALVIRADLEMFFSAIAARRVYGILRHAGYPEAVAYTITGLCTTVVPREVWQQVRTPKDFERHRRLGRALATPHLPQGAPTSPALANLVAFSLDRRLAGIAQRLRRFQYPLRSTQRHPYRHGRPGRRA